MTDNVMTCPICGVGTLTEVKREHIIDEPYAQPRKVDIVLQHCEACGSEGDFASSEDGKISAAVEASRQESVQTIIRAMEHDSLSMASVERALELPQRTLVKWKNGKTKASASAVALLRMIRTLPWLIDVADNAYDYDTAQKIHISNAMASLLQATEFKQSQLQTAGVITSSGNALVYFHYATDEGAESITRANTLSVQSDGPMHSIQYVE